MYSLFKVLCQYSVWVVICLIVFRVIFWGGQKGTEETCIFQGGVKFFAASLSWWCRKRFLFSSWFSFKVLPNNRAATYLVTMVKAIYVKPALSQCRSCPQYCKQCEWPKKTPHFNWLYFDQLSDAVKNLTPRWKIHVSSVPSCPHQNMTLTTIRQILLRRRNIIFQFIIKGLWVGFIEFFKPPVA